MVCLKNVGIKIKLIAVREQNVYHELVKWGTVKLIKSINMVREGSLLFREYNLYDENDNDSTKRCTFSMYFIHSHREWGVAVGVAIDTKILIKTLVQVIKLYYDQEEMKVDTAASYFVSQIGLFRLLNRSSDSLVPGSG